MEFEYWSSENGVCYAGDFVKAQSDIIALKIETLLKDLQKVSFLDLCRKNKVKKIKKRIHEVRLKVQSDNYRFLFVVIKNKGWILEAFKKKTEKTPDQYIKNAENRMLALDIQVIKNLI